VESIDCTVHTAVVLLLHSVAHRDVFCHLYVTNFMQFILEVMRQPMLKAVTQLSLVQRLRIGEPYVSWCMPSWCDMYLTTGVIVPFTYIYVHIMGWMVRGLNPDGARFSAPVRTGPGVHPASYTMGTGSHSLG
jgi:hypothetical protein